MKSVYIETTIVSYLTARPSRDLVNAARQELTWEWWDKRRHDFELFASSIVVLEASAGDREAAGRRLALLHETSILENTPETVALAAKLVGAASLPERATDDAVHLVTAAVHGVDFLLTWNCKHLANAELVGPFETFFLDNGYEPPVVCTPEELLERSND